MTPVAPVPITGLGCLCAAGPDLPACVAALYAGVRVPALPVRFTRDPPVRHPVFEMPEVLPPARGRHGRAGLSRTSLLALTAAREALEDAGWSPAALRRLRVGVCVGTTVGSALNNEAFYRAYRAGGRPGMDAIDRFLGTNPAAAVAREHGLSGPCQTVVNACSSGTDALGIAASWIRAGVCDVALAGGADELCRVTYNGFISLMITDEVPCRPFDRSRRGLNLGEGAAMLVLEAEPVRFRRARAARAAVLGYGSACDAHHLTAPHPDGRGLKAAVCEALETAGVDADRVAFVNAHGTGTPDNDRVESRALAEQLPGVPFVSTKGYTGHTLGAAGAIEAAFTVACLEQGKIPANVGFSEPDPELPAAPAARVTPVTGRVALSQSLAFGGSNAAVVLGLPAQEG
ncbi:MAG: beta-ketoacyl-[acyl-carrier-protein] synthase family protein [Deltaproteobacteria bacterium]|nr:beta-ketoacyl-[acyl-carrier-protein] synthase family protein [Deltaproteobacteria bacterium]